MRYVDVQTEQYDDGTRITLTNKIDGSKWVEWAGDDPTESMLSEILARWAEALLILPDGARPALREYAAYNQRDSRWDERAGKLREATA